MVFVGISYRPERVAQYRVLCVIMSLTYYYISLLLALQKILISYQWYCTFPAQLIGSGLCTVVRLLEWGVFVV